MRSRAVVLLAVLAAGCTSKPEPPPSPTSTGSAPASAVADPCANAKQEGPLAWIADDYPSALACARARKVPLVLDLWAPWCHTCLSMQTTVFVDPSFAADAKRFVFAALDTDREENAPALEQLAISAWPTFYVIGPGEAVMARFVGAASVAQFHGFLDAGARALAGGVAAADAHLLSAERALAVKDLATADTELTAAIAGAPADWERRPEVIGSLILTKFKRDDLAGCLQVEDQLGSATGSAAVASDVMVTATMCADKAEELAKGSAAPATNPDAHAIEHARRVAVARWLPLVADARAPLSVDDRSDAMASLRDTLDKLGDHAKAHEVAAAQRDLLDRTAQQATTPLAAMTYNWPRAEVYVYLGKPLDLVPALEQSAKDLPAEYDPLARLGWIYWKAKQLPAAAAWTDKALALVYGPRKARLLVTRADIARDAGDQAAELAFRRAAVEQYAHLPKGEENPAGLATAKTALAAIDH